MIIPIFICKRYLLKMKKLKLFIILFNFLITSSLFAQSPKAIEADLLQAFKKIDYNGQDNEAANKVFAGKLKAYAERYPFTLEQNFALLKAEHLDISSSTDGLFRIYSWDTWTGGSMHFFENVFQYKAGPKTVVVLDTPKTDGDNRPNYYKMYTFKVNNKAYYLGIYRFIESSKYAGAGINIFAIENGKLNNEVKLIKTQSGMHSAISYEYDFSSVMDIAFEKRPAITFDEQLQIISIPLVNAKGQVTNKTIAYKFTGQYFEKVKS